MAFTFTILYLSKIRSNIEIMKSPFSCDNIYQPNNEHQSWYSYLVLVPLPKMPAASNISQKEKDAKIAAAKKKVCTFLLLRFR